MDKGWIKLHRKILKNQFLNIDPTARHIFIILLLLADKRTGEWSGGRKQLRQLTGVNEMTIWKAIRRLNDEEMVEKRSRNGKYTTYRICKWDEYQHTEETPVKQSGNAREHSNKNREVRSKNNLLKTKQVSLPNRTIFLSLNDLTIYEEAFPTKNVKLEHDKAKDWLLSTGKVYKDYPAFFRGWLRRSDDKHVGFLDLSGKGKQ